MTNNPFTYELQADLKHWRPIETSLALTKSTEKGERRNSIVRNKPENKKFTKKKITKKPGFRVKATRRAVWQEPTSINIPSKRRLLRDKSKRKGVYNTPRSGYRHRPYRPKVFSKSGPYLPRKGFRVKITNKHRAAAWFHSASWAIRRKAYILRYSRPRLRLSTRFKFASSVKTPRRFFKLTGARAPAHTVKSPRLFGQYFTSTPSLKSWTYGRAQLKLLKSKSILGNKRLGAWGTAPAQASTSSANQWLGARYRKEFHRHPGRTSLKRSGSRHIRSSLGKLRRYAQFRNWSVAQTWGWKRYEWNRTLKRLRSEGKRSKKAVKAPDTRTYLIRSRFTRSRFVTKRLLPLKLNTRHTPSLTRRLPSRSTLLLSRPLRTGRRRFRTESWALRDRTHFFGRWRRRQRHGNRLRRLRPLTLSGTLQAPLVTSRRNSLLNYTKISSGKPVVGYKILKLKGRRKYLKKKQVLGKVLRLTRKMRGLAPAFKLGEVRPSLVHGSLQYLPSPSKGLFLFTRNNIKVVTNRTFTPIIGLLAPLTITHASYSPLYVLTSLGATARQLLTSPQSPYFETFLNQWESLTQLLWLDYNRPNPLITVRKGLKPRTLPLNNRLTVRKSLVLSSRPLKKRSRKLKRRTRSRLSAFTTASQKRSAKLYQKLLSKARMGRLKLRVLARTANAVNLAGRSRTLSFLKGALGRGSKRKFLGYEIQHQELFESDLIVVNYRYKAYSAFECFYNHRRDFRRSRALSDSLNVYRNDDRFENSFTR